MQKIEWGMIGVFMAVIIFLLNQNYGLQQAQLSDIKSDVSEIKEIRSDLSEIDERLSIVSMYLVRSGMPPIYGQPQENESDLRDISISIPINESSVNQTFSVQGKANLSNSDSIYVLSKIKGKYWILTEGISDQLGNWKGMKDCFIPTENKSGCERYELIAILTQNPFGIGSTFDEIPDYLARSNSTYVSKCKI